MIERAYAGEVLASGEGNVDTEGGWSGIGLLRRTRRSEISS